MMTQDQHLALFDRFLSGDVAARNELIIDLIPDIRRTVTRRVGAARADDFTNEILSVFIARDLIKYTPVRGTLRSYVRRKAIYGVLDALSASRRAPTGCGESEDAFSQVPAHTDDVTEAASSREFWAIIGACLSPKEVALLRNLYVDGKSAAVIAAQMDRSPSVVNKMRSQIQAKIHANAATLRALGGFLAAG